MTRKNNRHHTNGSAKAAPAESTARVDVPSNHKNELSLYMSSPPQSRRKNSPRRNPVSPVQIRSPTADIATVEAAVAPNGAGMLDDEDEEQSDDVDDDNICLICVAKCTCGKTEQPIRTKRESPVSPEPHYTRQRVKLYLSSPSPRDNQIPDSLPKRRGRPPRPRSPESTPIKNEANGHTYSTRSHGSVIVRDGRGPRKNGVDKPRRLSDAPSELSMDISDINLDDEEEEDVEDEDDSDEDESDDLGDFGDDLDIEGEEERAIIAEESLRLRSYSEDDDDADEEDDELDDEEDLFQVKRCSSSESSADEDHEFYQNDLYLDPAFCHPTDSLLSIGPSSPRRNSNGSDMIVFENPILRALVEEQTTGEESWYDSEQDLVGWECFIDDTDVEDTMHLDDESTRFGGGDTTDEEDFQLMGPPANPITSSSPKKKKKKSNNTAADVVTTSHQPPPLATWERDGGEITIIDALPLPQLSPLPSPARLMHSPPSVAIDLPSLDEYFDSSILVASPTSDNESMSDASASSGFTVTRTDTPRARTASTATATSFNTDSFVTPATRGHGRRKVPMGSYRRKVMLGERNFETQEKSVFLKEWYTLQERRNLRQMSKTRNLEFLDFSSPARGRRREKLRTARRARNDHDGSTELDLQFIKRRRTSDVQGSGSSAAAFMERLGLDAGDMSEVEDYDDDDFESESRVLNEVGESMVLDDDLELAQFIVPPPGGIDLSPLFGAVDA